MADKKISALTAAASPLAGTEVLPIVQSGATVKVSVADLSATQNKFGVSTPAMNWSSGGHVDVPNDGGLFSKGVFNNIGANWVFDGALKYQSTGAASWYQQNSGYHVWYSAASGTGGAPIVSFPETMALFPNGDLKLASGNLVFTTSGKGIDFSATPGTGTSELLADYEEGTWTPTVAGSWTVTPSIFGTATYTKIGRSVTINFAFLAGTKATTFGGYFDGLPYNIGVVATGAVVDNNIENRGLAEATGTTRVYVTGLSFPDVNFVTVTYFV